jgi:hypothetical protein
MDRPLFTHGPLSDPALLGAVLGRPVPSPMRLAATAPGFVALCCGNGRRAALVRRSGAAVDGLLVLGLTAFEADLLDAFAGDDFCRSVVAVMLDEELHEANASVPVARVPRDAEPWSLLRWQANHKPQTLVAARAVAPDSRARLIAIRPN